jgi:hypothetical protein
VRIVDLRRQKRHSFSAFSFVEEEFATVSLEKGFVSLRRLFSQSRHRHGKTLLIEKIRADGAIADENDELTRLFPGYRPGELLRYSFWNVVITQKTLKKLSAEALLGFAILKRDIIPSLSEDRWHIFESVFRVPPTTFVPCAKDFRLRVANNSRLAIRGVLYCEQNGFNKACAQVAIRTLAASADTDRPYFSEINARARRFQKENPHRFINRQFAPELGLHPPQIAAALEEFGLKCDDIDYEQEEKEDRKNFPFHRFLYAGLESGAGALVGFKYGKRRKRGEGPLKHILPVFGHTFGQDAWVPRSESAYFRVGESKYIPSDAWLGSFVCHDDRFGSNYCSPRFYIDRKTVRYVAALIPPGAEYSGVIAEAYGIQALNTLMDTVKKQNQNPADNPWAARLITYHRLEQVVLRAIPLKVNQYFDHLRGSEDWEFRQEHSFLYYGLRQFVKVAFKTKTFWMVEISVPELFPINQRKIGEILLDAEAKLQSSRDRSAPPFVLARLVGNYYLPKRRKGSYHEVVSNLKSHIPIFSAG